MSQPLELVDDLIEEFLLRCPPDDPDRLARAALVSKRWYRLISGRQFRRRFVELHGTAPMLGFFYSRLDPLGFHSVSSFLPPRDDFLRNSRVLDARHGRVLLHNLSMSNLGGTGLMVWDPFTGVARELPIPRFLHKYSSWTAAILCPVAGCEQLDCGRGAGCFLVVFVATDLSERFTSSYVYSSEAGSWSKLTAVVHNEDRIDLMPSVLVGNTLYFLFERGLGIQKHDCCTREISVIKLPPAPYSSRVLTTSEGGNLGLATIEESRLFLWSREVSSDGYAEWKQTKFIDIEDALSVRALLGSPQVVGFADGIGLVLVRIDETFFTVDAKSNLVKKIGEGRGFFNVVPYLSFYTPALGASSLDGRPRAAAPHTGGACKKASRSRGNLAGL